jgi:hexosaminidase
MSTAVNAEKQITTTISGVTKDRVIYYTLDGTVPTVQSAVYSHPLVLQNDATVVAAVISNGQVTDQLKKSFTIHKAAGKPVTLQTPPDPRYSKGGPGAWANGSMGNDEHFSDDEWLGWDGKTFEGTIDFGGDSSTSSLQTRFFQKKLSWVWVPKRVTVEISSDGKTFSAIAEQDVPIPASDGAINFTLSWAPVTARFMRIIVEPLDAIPAANTGAGDQPWLFVDEMIVH